MTTVSERGGAPTAAQFHAAISSRSDRWFAACLRITRSRELAEDAVQEALLCAWHKRHQFRQSAELATWIHRIAVNAALQLIRKQRPGQFGPLDEGDYADSGAAPVDQVAQDELATRFRRACAILSDIERTCFRLKHLEQWRIREIADALDISDGTVKQAIFRAVKKLRVRLAALKSTP